MSARTTITLALAATALTAGLTAAVPASAATPAAVPGPVARAADDCSVWADGRLHCGNAVGAKGYADRSYNSAERGTLTSSFSWFQCWGHGDRHAGGNDIWYWTQLDNGQWGNVPAVSVKTPVDPAPGLSEC